MAGSKKVNRKDDKNRVLHDGESQRKDGTYMYRWSSNGKRSTIYASTLQELRDKEEKIKADLHDGINIVGSNMTLNVLFEQSMSVRTLKPSTRSNYIAMWNANVKDSFLGNMKIADVRPNHIKIFYIEDCVKQKNLKKNTIKLLQNLIFSSFENAVDNDLIRKNPAKKALKDFEDDAAEKIPLTEKQVAELIEFCSNHSCYNIHVPFLVVALGTGLRCSEICGLQWCDVDLNNKELTVDHQLVYKNVDGTGCKFYISTPKTKAGIRKIPLTDSVCRAFVELKKQNMILGRVCEFEIDGYSNFCFISGNGQPFATNAVNSFLYGIQKAYNNKYPETPLPHISAHILRHTACTLYARARMDIKALQSIMGHQDASITMNIYNHADDEHTRNEISRLNNVINF